MSMSFQTRFLAAAIQTSQGVAATYTGANLIPCMELTHQPLVSDVQSRETVDGRGGAKAQYLTRKRATVTAVVEAAGGGAAGTAPFYDTLIQACGWSRTINAGVSVVYRPVTAPSLVRRATLVGGFGGSQAVPGVASDVIQEIIDGLGSLSFSAAEGQLPRFTATMTGIYANPVARSVPTAGQPLAIGTLAAAGYLETTEVNFLNSAFTYGGDALALRECSFADQAPVIFADRPNDVETRRGVRRITGRMVITAPAFGTFDYLVDSVTAVPRALSFTHRTTAGQIVQITAPRVQAIFAEWGNDQDEVTASFDLTFLPDAGDDEITITVR